MHGLDQARRAREGHGFVFVFVVFVFVVFVITAACQNGSHDKTRVHTNPRKTHILQSPTMETGGRKTCAFPSMRMAVVILL